MKKFSPPLFVLITAVFGFLLIPSSSFTAQEKVNLTEDCLDCHEDYDKTLRGTVHQIVGEEHDFRIACSDCHPGSEAHLEDPSEETIVTPGKLAGREVIQICTQCHTHHNDMDNYGFDSHTIEQLSCADCHKVHGANASLLLDDRAEFCIRCHDETRMQFRKRSNHPVMQQNITCLDCHRFTKRQGYDFAYEIPGHCRDCHPEQGGPFPYEHEAVNAYSIEGGSCLECHEPHGSENDWLLKQPDNRLCNQCHFPAGHATAHSGIWAKYACQTCHIDTHGSFVSKFYLDPDLPAKLNGDCYNPGCHSIN